MTTIKDIINTINKKRTKVSTNTANVKERMGVMNVGKNFIRLGSFQNSNSYKIYK